MIAPFRCEAPVSQEGYIGMDTSGTVVPDQRLIWDDWHRSHLNASPSAQAELLIQEFLTELPPPSREPRILEVGCGQGREAISLAKAGLTVSAFDLSPLAIRMARENALSAQVPVDFREHDLARELPYADGQFDGVFAHLSLHYFDDAATKEIFNDLARVSSPDAVLLFTVRSVFDHFYGQGDQVDDKLFCHEGHLRGFFDDDYFRTALSQWSVDSTEYYEVQTERKLNPGKFLKVLARRI
jgi:SAM-dependent methyltransferase